jgi:hypothetical protein
MGAWRILRERSSIGRRPNACAKKAVNEESLEIRQAMENVALQWELLAEGLEPSAKRSSRKKSPAGARLSFEVEK